MTLLAKLSFWRARRVVIVSDASPPALYLHRLLHELGAKPVLIGTDAGAHALNLALTAGRVSAVIVPKAHGLSPDCDPAAHIAALSALMCEAREAGVPQVVLCSDAPVYTKPFAREEDPLGGMTQEGFIQAVCQLYARGFGYGFLGDGIGTLVLRHMPCLGSGSACTQQYTRWCQQLLDGLNPEVTQPGMQGVFLHPLDVACAILLLGAAAYGRPYAACNIAAGSANMMANRSAAARLARRIPDARPLRETAADAPPFFPLDASPASSECRCLISGDDALFQLYALEQALRQGTGIQEIERQTRSYLQSMPSHA